MLIDYIERYQKVRDKRAELEQAVAKLKEAENSLKANMLAQLDASGLDSIKEGGYTIFRKHNIRAEIIDHAKLQGAMFELMTKAHDEGRPLQDGLLLQRTVAKTTVLDRIHSNLGLEPTEELDVNDQATIDEAAKLGLRLVDVIDLSIRKK